MERLGRPLTWRSRCFIKGGCGAQIWSHTNGNGDYVMFDELGWPWPIHECYFDRTPGDRPPLAGAPDWDHVRPVQPDVGLHRRVDIVGTLTNYDEAKLGRVAGFRNLSRKAQDSIKAKLGAASSLITVVTGIGEEYMAFADLRDVIVAVRDTVGVRLKAIELLTTTVFVVTQIKRIDYR